MPATLTTVSNIVKEVYGPRIVDQLENEIVVTKRMEKTSDGTVSEVGGKYVTFPLKTRRNAGIGYRNEMETLQSAGQQGYASVRVPLRYGYGRVQLSGPTMELVDENYNAFSTAIQEEMEGLKTDIAKDTNRILWGNGVGTLGTCDTTAAASNTHSFGATDEDVKYFDLDMMIDILTNVGGVVASNRKITAINEATGDITFDGAAVAATAGNIAVRTGNFGREPQGLTSMISASGVLFNLDPAVEPLWKATEDNTGGALSESKMIAMCDNIRKKGGRPSVVFCDLGTRRAYFNLLTTQRRFTGVKDYTGGFSGLSFQYDDDIPVVTDVDAPAKKMWFVDEKRMKVYRSKPWYFDDKDGSMWRQVANSDAFEALMKQYWEFGCERRNTHGVMTNITAG